MVGVYFSSGVVYNNLCKCVHIELKCLLCIYKHKTLETCIVKNCSNVHNQVSLVIFISLNFSPFACSVLKTTNHMVLFMPYTAVTHGPTALTVGP